MIGWSQVKIRNFLLKILLNWEDNFKASGSPPQKKSNPKREKRQKVKDKINRQKLLGNSKPKESFSPILCKEERVKLDLMWRLRILIS